MKGNLTTSYGWEYKTWFGVSNLSKNNLSLPVADALLFSRIQWASKEKVDKFYGHPNSLDIYDIQNNAAKIFTCQQSGVHLVYESNDILSCL